MPPPSAGSVNPGTQTACTVEVLSRALLWKGAPGVAACFFKLAVSRLPLVLVLQLARERVLQIRHKALRRRGSALTLCAIEHEPGLGCWCRHCQAKLALPSSERTDTRTRGHEDTRTRGRGRLRRMCAHLRRELRAQALHGTHVTRLGRRRRGHRTDVAGERKRGLQRAVATC